ncbi:hypothetical protein CkaCkLH20_06471 [Colletotrichum karsti]|uniref:Uncharacterized protein n=1 Tax=Colletotrichum karsti TaxID=1095194 RepID=A0A9P6ICB6_9PEZI|nr:uncharacterized protein CkaCkLH20_06471 [Colletotrichum karsti]KAF9876025.1 hypothetical protein CkaCkLH20_06471 [Colletotrichum karsti]
MFIPGIVQALVAALTFGIVLNAASAAVFLFAKGHGSKIFRDGLRLVLITFLASAALWAQIDFAALTIDPTAISGCQVAVIFATIFDQLARFAIEQYLLWAINSNAKTPTGAMIPQAVIGTRFILGAVFVGFQKPQIATVCVSKTDVLPIGVVIMITDFLIIGMLAFRANSLGLITEARSGRPSSQNKKAVLWTMVGFAVWTAGSIPLLLGAENIELIFRTAVPATALSLLVGIVTGFSDSLLPPRPQQATHPDAQSPRNISSSRDIGTSDSDYPPTRYEDLKAGTITTVSTFNQPRDAPRPDVPRGADGALPIIAGSVPGQAMIGVGGVPVQGQLFPPIRAQTAPVRESKRIEIKQPNKQYKRSIFDRGPGSNIKHAISNPILQESGERNPLNKIATIDLATAAQNDRERRDNDMATMQQSPSLIAQRPAPRPPAITPEEALKRAQSTKRKEVGPASPPPAEPQPLKSAGLMSNPPATTSSAQLSPGVEELRRRSPRVSPRQSPEPVQQNETETRPFTPPKQSAPASSISPPRPPRPERPLSPFETMERSGSQKTVDRSMSQKTMTIDRTASQKSTATTMTRTMSPSTGLVPPPPPRSAARLMSPTKKPDLPSTWPIQSAVDPAIRPSRNKPLSPKGQDASAAPGLQRRPTTTGLPSNPRAMTMRPLPKDAVSKEQTVLFVNNIQYNDPTGVQNIIQGAVSQAAKTPLGLQSPGSALKSSGSIVHRPRPIPRQPGKDRPIFPAEDTPNHKRRSPTQLPPLPPPPKSAGAPVRPLPNDTKSMTFDEKMDLFFPRPPSSSDGSSRPRESIPEMPVLPAAYKPESNAVAEDRGGWDTSRVQSKQSSNRSTKTSVRTESILDIEEPQHALNYPRNTSKFSVDTSIVSGRDRDSWIPDLPVDDRTRGKSYDGVKRQSSPVLPVRNPSLSEFSETRTHDEVATTNWGSIHSPVAAVNIQEVTHMPKPTWIQPRDVSMISHNDGKEVIDIMLDASVEHERDFVPSVQEINEGPADLPDVSVANRGARWHRRVGDACATFSERDEKVNSRRMPPPRALQLKSPTRRNNAVVLQVAEPSPLESPQHAYEMIQAQLKKLEEPTRDSYESQGQRIRLLESLEAEMGQQESQWHEMQHGLTRDSLSTVGTTSVRNSQQEPSNVSVHSRDSSLHSTIAADRRASRRARIQSGASLSKSSYEDLRSASSSSSGNNRTSLWEQRLADAQMEYMENATELLAKRNLNFLSVSKARVSAQLGSPTPPDTDESDGVDAQILATLMPKERAAPAGQLWAPISPVYSEREPTLLWRPAHDVANKTSKSGADAALPGLSVRPAARKSAEPLLIESVQLWQPDHTAAKKLRNSTSSLWRTSFVAEPPKPARPVTQRPPRRSKRITALPDILENPEPLPDKRGTLGIFQFPWGERSDTATVQPRPSHMFMAMPGTMSTGGTAVRAALEARAQQLQAQEYSSSFFDDYDEEEEGDDEVSDINEDDESDDGFDETTLWEIASLLQSDQVPSKNSLLPQPTYYRPDSLMEEEEYISQSSEYPSDDEKTAEGEDDTKHDSLVMSAVAEELPTPPKPSSLLWTGKPKRYVSVRLPPGLLQPDARTWATYVDTNPIPRVQAQRPEPATIYSTTLWSAPMPAAQKSVGLLWSQQTVKTDNKTKAPTMRTMWIAPVVIVEKEANGLFDPSEKRITFRTTSASPVGLSMSSTARVTVEALPVLTSTSLWASQQLSTKTLWALPAVVIEAAEGLFDASHKRAVFRTTTATPVGLAMSSSTARVTETALPVLTSTSLWTASPAALEAQDWISVGSANSSGRSTPTLDTASTRSLATEAVSDFDPLPAVEAKRPTWWENNAEKPQERLQRTEVTPADWEAALNEAIAATAPLPSPLVRTVATPEQWADALNEAIGTTSTPASLDRTAASPAQWEDALNEAIAASSYVPEVPVQEVQQQQYFEQPEFEQQQYNEQPQFDQEPYYEQQQFDQQAFDQQEFERREYERYMNEQRLFEQQMYNQRLLEEQMYQQQQYYGQQQQQYEPQYDAQYQPLYTEPQYEPQLDQPIEPQFEQQQVYEPEPEFLQPTLYVEPATEPKEQLFEPEQPVSVSPAKSPLWSAPEVTVSSETGIMWIAPAKPLLHAHDTAPLTPEDSESRQLRLKRSKTPPPPSTIVSFEGQGMWKSLSAPVTPGFPPLWSAPEVTVSEDTGIMWIAPAKPPLHAHDTAPLTPEDSVSRQLRLKRSKTPPPPSTIVSFEGQGMWKSLSAPVTPGFPPMWSAPEITAPKDTGIMWIRPAKPARHSYDTAPLTPEDSESRNLRLKRSKAQSTGGLVNFDGTAMWNHEGADASRIAPLGGGRNWIEGEIFRI